MGSEGSTVLPPVSQYPPHTAKMVIPTSTFTKIPAVGFFFTALGVGPAGMTASGAQGGCPPARVWRSPGVLDGTVSGEAVLLRWTSQLSSTCPGSEAVFSVSGGVALQGLRTLGPARGLRWGSATVR